MELSNDQQQVTVGFDIRFINHGVDLREDVFLS